MSLLTTLRSRGTRIEARRRAPALIGAVLLAVALDGVGAEAANAAGRDADSDGVADRFDLCPATPSGAKVVAQGCTALDIALAPQVLIDAGVEQLARQRTSLAGKAASAGADLELAEGAAALSRSASETRRGEVCAGADLAERAIAELEVARREIAGAKAAGPAMLPALTAKVALDLAAQAAPFLRAACNEQVGRFRERGTVTEVRDAERRFRLGKGPLIGLAEGYYPVGPIEGMEIEVSGIQFADGSRLATTVRGKAPQPSPLKTQQCLELWIAPFQEFPPFVPADTLFFKRRLEGYAGPFGVLNLERRQRFAAVDDCPPPSLGTSYSMKIDVSQGGNTWTIATNLQESDVPVDLPTGWVESIAGQVSATVQKTVCVFGCTTTTLGTHTVHILVRPTGSYVTLVYDKTRFDVGGNGVFGDYERAKVTGLSLSSLIPSDTPPTLKATGYQAPVGDNPDTVAHEITVNQPFAIWDYDTYFDDDMYDEQQLGTFALAELRRTGVNRPSGLVWPQVTGTHNGTTFTYIAKVPMVVRDRIVNCAGALDSHYESPFNGTSAGLVMVTKGNSDDPVAGHSGTASFALDFSGPSGQWVHAARPGVVFAMDDSHSTNPAEPGAGIDGNFILVRHEDETFGLYYHLAQNSVPSDIAVGQRVNRLMHIASFGASQLHFEVGDLCHPIGCSSSAGYDSVKVLYDVWVETLVFPPLWNSTHKTCYVPRVNDRF
jgi:hypothetical protein